MSTADARQRFDRAAATFDTADFVHAVTREGLFARLAPMTVTATTVLDLGAATGAATRLLRKRFRGATVIALDLSRAMLERAARRAGSWLSKAPAVQADAARLPMADGSVDLVFSNLLLPWIDDRRAVFGEVARVLRAEGLFLFATLGPDSLGGWCRRAFADMHDVGDELLRAGLRDPVLDVDRLTVNYKDSQSLADDLAAIGAAGCRTAGPGGLDVELELVYGHCWGSGQPRRRGEIRVPAEQIATRKV